MSITVTVPAELAAAVDAIEPACQIRTYIEGREVRHCTDKAEWILTITCGCDQPALVAACTPHKVLLPRFLNRIHAVCTYCCVVPTITAAEAL